MEIKISCDYTKEKDEIIICTHHTVDNTMSIIAGNLTLDVTANQVADLIKRLNKGLNTIQEYEKLMNRVGGNGT